MNARIKEVFVAIKADLSEPASEDEILQAEKRLAITFPSELRNFYRLCNGFQRPANEWMWNFWPLPELKTMKDCGGTASFEVEELSSEFDPAKIILFADVMIDAPVYVFLCDPHSPHHEWVFADQGGESFVSARSMEEFFSNFCNHHDDILLFPKEHK